MPELIRPDGWKPGLPVLEVSRPIVDALGLPEVDYDGVDQLFGRELALSADNYPITRLVAEDGPLAGLREGKVRGGQYLHKDKVIKLFPLGVSRSLDWGETSSIRLAECLAHEAQHHKDFTEHPVRTHREKYLRLEASGLTGLLVNAAAGYEHLSVPVAGVLALGVAAATAFGLHHNYYDRNPLENRARAFAAQPVIRAAYSRMVVFSGTQPEVTAC
jgi:hypothetical protein